MAELVLKGGRVLNVYSSELLRRDVLIKEGKIVSVDEDIYGRDSIELRDRVIVPGYIDCHFHPWFIYNPLEFAKEACTKGITTLFCDNLMFYMVMDLDLFEDLMESLSELPIKLFWFVRAVPQTPMEDEKKKFSKENIKRLLSHPLVKSLGEITRWPKIIEGDENILELIHYANRLGKRVDGHTAGARYNQIERLSSLGIESCHEAINKREALERLRAGMYVMMRESSLRRDLKELLRIVTEEKVHTERLMLTTDCSSPAFYERYGILDYLIKIALDSGIDPIAVYKMVTLNPSVYFRMEQQIGAIAPGRDADMVILEDLSDPLPQMVISKGEIIAEDGKLCVDFPDINWNRYFKGLNREILRYIKRDIFSIDIGDGDINFPVIELISPVITRCRWMELNIREGIFDIRAREDLSHISVLNREGRWISNGLIKGFGRVGGLCSSFNTASQILIIGRDIDDMINATIRMLELGGGIVIADRGKIIYELPLPLGGVMSDRSMGYLASKDRELCETLSNFGYSFYDPLYTLVFLPNDFLPEVRINYKGIVDIKRDKILWPKRVISL